LLRHQERWSVAILITAWRSVRELDAVIAQVVLALVVTIPGYRGAVHRQLTRAEATACAARVALLH
jgi:hypothetical protein